MVIPYLIVATTKWDGSQPSTMGFKWLYTALNNQNIEWLCLNHFTCLKSFKFPLKSCTLNGNGYISRIGNSSFDIYQEAWQQDKKCSSGTAVMVHFDHDTKKYQKISETIISYMNNHFVK